MAKTEIIGSWYNSGFHGHYRSKCRLDFPNEYRHLAKPAPPWKFFRRLQEGSNKHKFSNHDNRQSFLNDALYFEEGLGRKRIPNKTNQYQAGFLAWSPHKEELDKAGPKISTYKRDFHTLPNQPYKQQIISRPRTSFDPEMQTTTSYRYSHGRDNPNKSLLSAMSNDGLKPTWSIRQPRTKSAPSTDSVASCLSWHVPNPPSQRRASVSAATMTNGNLPTMTQTAPVSRETTSISLVTMSTTCPPALTQPQVTTPPVAMTTAE